MNNILMLLKSNVKKTKAQTVAIFVLITITVLLIHLSLMLALDYQSGYDVLHDELDEADVTLMIAGLDSEIDRFECDYLREKTEIDSYQISPVAILDGSVPYGEYDCKAVFFAIRKSEADAKTVSKYRYDSESEGSGAFLPYAFGVSGHYSIGDRFTLCNNGKNVIDTVVRGFYSATQTSGEMSRICGFILTDDLYGSVDQTQSLPIGQIRHVMASVRLKEGVDSSRFEYNAISDIAKEYTKLKLVESNNTTLVKSTDYATQVITVAVLGVAGLVFAIVCAVLIASNIAFFIQTNMKSFGMLKAVGYRSKTLRFTILAEFVIVGIVASLCGTALAYAVFPPLNTLTESITGIPYPIRFMWKPFAIAFAVVMLLILITARFATRGIKRLPPIAAIREVDTGKGLKSNTLPVEKSILPIHLTLALKTALMNRKQNLIVFIALLGISLGSVFCVLMYQNVVQDQAPIIELTNQNAHSFVRIAAKDDGSFRQFLESDDRVENYYIYSRRSKVLVNDEVLLSIVIDDGKKIDNDVMVYSGTMPENENELALGVLFAANNGISLGDTVTASLGGITENYRVSALVQFVGNAGSDVVFTIGGYTKLTPLGEYDYLITLRDPTGIAEFNAGVTQAIPGAYTENYEKYIIGSTADFIGLMRFIIIGIILICVLLMAFVLYVLVKTVLLKKQKEYSILKSIGYPTKVLIAQTALSFLPVVFLSLAVGLPLASFTINDIFSLFIRNLGVFRTAFSFSALWVFLSGVLAFVLAGVFLCVFSLKIRKYSPKQLLSDN